MLVSSCRAHFVLGLRLTPCTRGVRVNHPPGGGFTLPLTGVCFWLYPVFEAVRYGEIQRDTAVTAGYS